MDQISTSSNDDMGPSPEEYLLNQPNVLQLYRNFFLTVTFTKYKVGNPVLYVMRVELFRKPPEVAVVQQNINASSSDHPHDHESDDGPTASSPMIDLAQLQQNSRSALLKNPNAYSLGHWYVKRRYSEMEAVHQELLKRYGGEIVQEKLFPGKGYLPGYFFSAEDQAKDRMEQLQKYYDALLVYNGTYVSKELQSLLRLKRPEPPQNFRVLSFGLNDTDNVYAICEIGDEKKDDGTDSQAAAAEHTLARSSTNSLDTITTVGSNQKNKGSDQKAKANCGRSSLAFAICIRKVIHIGFSSESLVFIREDMLENTGRKQHIMVPLGPPKESYDLVIAGSNYAGKSPEIKCLHIRLLAPGLEDLLDESDDDPSPSSGTNVTGVLDTSPMSRTTTEKTQTPTTENAKPKQKKRDIHSEERSKMHNKGKKLSDPDKIDSLVSLLKEPSKMIEHQLKGRDSLMSLGKDSDLSGYLVESGDESQPVHSKKNAAERTAERLSQNLRDSSSDSEEGDGDSQGIVGGFGPPRVSNQSSLQDFQCEDSSSDDGDDGKR